MRYIASYAARVGIPTAGMRLVDGSAWPGPTGSRRTRSPPCSTSAALDVVPTFRAALPVAGLDPVRWSGGTLASRMRGTAAAGNLRAKNGTLTGVTSLVGYVSGADGRRYVFVMVSNYGGASPRPVEDGSAAARPVAHDEPLTRGSRCVGRVVA